MSIQTEINRLNAAKETLTDWMDSQNISYDEGANLTTIANTISDVKTYYDSLPINSIIDYEGDTVPDGYEVVANPTYSTTEQKTGETWIDGKPIYRRTFVGNTGTSAQTVITSAYNNDTIRVVNAYGSVRVAGGGVNIGSYVNGNYFAGLFTHSSELQLYFGQSLKNGTYMITIEFTKTTD